MTITIVLTEHDEHYEELCQLLYDNKIRVRELDGDGHHPGWIGEAVLDARYGELLAKIGNLLKTAPPGRPCR